MRLFAAILEEVDRWTKQQKKKNWVYYMQEGLKSMWKKKEVSELRVVDDAGVDIKTGKYVGDNSSLDKEQPTTPNPYGDDDWATPEKETK